MSEFKLYTKPLFSVALSLVLVACGGGGSGDGDGGGSNPSALQLDPAGYGERTVAIREDSDADGVIQFYSDMELPLDLIDGVQTEVQGWAPASVDGDVYRFNCDNAGGTIRVRSVATETSVDETWELNNCELSVVGFGTMELDGSVRYVERYTSDTRLEGFQELDVSGELTVSGEQIAVRGRDDWTAMLQSDDTVTSRYETDYLEFLWGDTYIALTDQVVTATGDDAAVEATMQAKIVSSAIDGYATLSTPVALVAEETSDCPLAGVLRLESDGYIEVRFGSSTNTAEVAVVEMNGSRVEGFDTCAELGFNPL